MTPRRFGVGGLAAWLGVALLTLSACGSSSPSSPSPSPAARTWKLSGTVRTTTGVAVPGASVRVLDGLNASQVTSSDNAGAYTFAGLQESGFTVQASAAGYLSLNAPVTLTADRVQDFSLTRIAAAKLEGVAGSVPPQAQADGTYGYTIPAINSGDGCAGSVAGVVTFVDANSRTVAAPSWTLSASTIIRPAQQFVFTVSISSDAALSARTYSTAFTYVTVACS